jgi:hypothetical protein
MGAPGRRFVSFLVLSEGLSGADLSARLGPEGEPRSRGQSVRVGPLVVVSPSNRWQLKSLLSPSAVVEDHLDDLYRRVKPLTSDLRKLVAEGAECILRVVQYMPNDPSSGYGVPIAHEWVVLLAQVGGRVDIDLYVEERDASA